MIEAQTKKAGSPAEVQLSKEIATAFADYLSRVSKSLAMPQVTPESTASRVAEQEVETGLERLLALGEKLTTDNRSAAEHFVTDANAALVRLQRFLFVALLSLSISGIAIVVLGGDSVPRKKPAPDPILRAASALGVQASECAVVGDTENDVRAGKAAGARTIGVTWGYGTRARLEAAGVDYLIETPEALPPLLRALTPSTAA